MALYQGCFLFGKMDGCSDCSLERTHSATLAADLISPSSSELLFRVSIVADHLAVRIATIRQVAIKSESPIFGQSGTSL